ncbi:MAG: guanylate kinase [Gemmatimonadales bacterium]|nr:guanylate kinase [Gemmatimonadales bacterium]MYG48440.1 guanylate kinase [Gemmatimonadales bacterium]MYK00346.1 guanylate kinase [Candidatus Palauibacter ramosifaciens]
MLSGPSGAGKTTIRDRLLAEPRSPGFLFSVSMTTRAPRARERDGVDYRFVSRSRFEALVDSGAMLEHATVHGERYGTPRENLHRAREGGAHLLLDIDVQGARQVWETVAEVLSIFIVPPTGERIARQLKGRGSESPEQLRHRLANARSELKAAAEFDRLVVNDRIEEAVVEVSARVAEGLAPGRRLGAADRRYVKRIIGELDAL